MKRTARFPLAAAALTLTLDPAAAAPPSWTTQLTPATSMVGDPVRHFTVAERMDRARVPGLGVAIVDHCRMVERREFGTVTPGGPAVTSRTRFQAASISKTVTAVAALRLVDQHRLSLDKDLRGQIPNWVASGAGSASPLTLRQLLSHTGGVGVHGFAGYAAGEPLPTQQQILAGTPPANNAPIRLEAMPGRQFRYSGGGYVLVQGLMTAQAGDDFPSLIRRLVLQPLRMDDSDFRARPAGAAGVALGHGKSGAALPGGWKTYPELSAAGLWSTPVDLAKLAIAMMGSALHRPRSILGSATAGDMLSANGPGNWGLGVELRGAAESRRFMHTGQSDGYLSLMVGVPSSCSGIVVMMNGEGGADLLREVVRAVAAERGWPELVAAKTFRPLNPAEVAGLAGRYAVERPAIEIEIRPGGTGDLELLVAGRPNGRILADTAGGLVVTGAVLEPLAAIRPERDGSLSVTIGDREFIARRKNGG